MATHEIPIINQSIYFDSGVYTTRIGNQITTTNDIGDVLAILMNDGGSDVGMKGKFNVPQNYVGTPVIVIKGVLDGAPGASDTLGFGIKGTTIDDNESADAASSTEDVASATIGSSGSNHADEDLYEETISLSNYSGFAVGDTAFFYFYVDTSGTSYTGNFLLTDLLFRYSDT